MGTGNRGDREDELYQLALETLVETEALKECENHEGYYFAGSGDLEITYKLAAARTKACQITLTTGETQIDVTGAIKRAYGDYSSMQRCPVCPREKD